MSASYLPKGMYMIRQATEVDTRVTQSGSSEPNRYDEAIGMYMNGIEYFNQALMYETNEKSKQTIRAKMQQYISRVETLKGVNTAPAPAPAPKKAAAAGDGKAGGGKEEDDEKSKFCTSEGQPPSAEPEPDPALAPLPAIPPSPVSGRTLENSHFKVAYGKAKAPNSMLKLGLKLGDLIQYHCSKNYITFDDDEGERFFEELQGDMKEEDTVDEAVQRMWTSYRNLHGKEICYMLNEVTRDDPEDGVAPTAALTRAMNKMCVTAGKTAVYPPNGMCYRGGGFDDQFRDFFAPGRAFRQPAFLATSFLEETAQKFIRMRGDGNCVLWRVHIDPERGCRHVNAVTRVVPGLADEQEYLFAPYSAFTVLTANWNAGTSDDPHVIDLLAAVDNKEAPEDLPLAPWS